MRLVFLLLALSLATTAARAELPDEAIARAHQRRGAELYERGDYRAALAEFEAARRKKALPAFDYNIGRCYERLGAIPEAIRAYRAYVAATVGAESEQVQAHIAELERGVAVAAPPPDPQGAAAADPSGAAPPSMGSPTASRPLAAPAIDARPRPPTPGGIPLAAPVVMAAGAAALLAAGAGSYGWARAGVGELAGTCAPACDPASWAGYQRGERAGYALFAVGGALLVADVALWIARGRQRQARSARVAASR